MNWLTRFGKFEKVIPKIKCIGGRLNGKTICNVWEVLCKITEIEIVACSYNPWRGYLARKTAVYNSCKTGHCVKGITCRYIHEDVQALRDGIVLTRRQSNKDSESTAGKDICVRWDFTSQRGAKEEIKVGDTDIKEWLTILVIYLKQQCRNRNPRCNVKINKCPSAYK